MPGSQLRYSWRLKWLFWIAIIFFLIFFLQCKGNVIRNWHAKSQVEIPKLYRDIREQSFVSKANLPGKIRRPTALQTPFTWFGNPKGCCRWQLVDIKPCHLIRKFLYDRKKSWLQGTTRQLWTIWMRRSAMTGKWISFLKESCSFCVLHWFGLVNKISVCRLVFREVLRAF